MKIARTALILVLLAAAFGLSRWYLRAEPPSETDEIAFFYDLLQDLNADRELVGRSGLIEDVFLQQWVQQQVDAAASTEDLQTNVILDRLQDEVPSVASASIFVAFSRDERELHRKLVEWAREDDGEHTHVATRLFRSPNHRGIGGLALLVQRLPRFEPSLLSDANQSFYNVCPICDKPHLGRVTPASRSIVLECPKCNRQYDLLAVDMKGRYHRVIDYLTGEEPTNALPWVQSRTRLEEMFKIWKEVLNHCRYVEDFSGIHGRRDSWQSAEETQRYRNGDCEDTSILLADWLIERGYEARVALGRTDRLEGHAWCVVRLDGVEYILETTEAKPDLSKPPTVENFGRGYHPEFLFDRKQIYFREKDSWTSDYWSESEWTGVSYGEADRAAAPLSQSALPDPEAQTFSRE